MFTGEYPPVPLWFIKPTFMLAAVAANGLNDTGLKPVMVAPLPPIPIGNLYVVPAVTAGVFH